MLLRYFFATIPTVVTDSCYNLKLPPYAPVFYVKTPCIKMCIHPQGVGISTFSNITYKNTFFLGYSSGANQINAMIQNGHCKQS